MVDKISLEPTTNAKAIEDSLSRVVDYLRIKIAEKAVRKAQEPVLAATRANLARVQSSEATGGLLSSLMIKVWSGAGSSNTTAMVGGQYPVGQHLHLVEFGHEPSGWYASGDRVPGKEFLAPAVAANKGRLQSVLIAELKKGVEQALKQGGGV